MAETSYLWDNPGTGDSPAGGYGNAALNRAIFRMLLGSAGDRGVLYGWLDSLEVTDGGGLDAAVGAGAALCYGAWHESDEAETVALPDNSTVHVVVRADWAAQTARLAQVAALTQNPGVTYDVPLAEVTTAGGAIALITDERDYCEYSTVPWPFGVTAAHLQPGAATVAKMIDQTRWLQFSSGALEPDATNPCVWASHLFSSTAYRDAWEFADAATTGGWLTVRVPADFVGPNLEIRIRTNRRFATDGDVRWCYSAWIAADGGLLSNVSGATLVTYNYTLGVTPYDTWLGMKDALIASLAVSAGDIVHVHLYRDGAHGDDTLTETAYIHFVEGQYLADS